MMPSIFEIVVEITPGHHLPAAHEGTVAMQQNCTPEALSISWRDCMNDRNWLMGIFEDVPWHLRGRKISAPRREWQKHQAPISDENPKESTELPLLPFISRACLPNLE
jgi:hypothetical protein